MVRVIAHCSRYFERGAAIGVQTWVATNRSSIVVAPDATSFTSRKSPMGNIALPNAEELHSSTARTPAIAMAARLPGN